MYRFILAFPCLIIHHFTINIKFYSKTLKTCANPDRDLNEIITNNMYFSLFFILPKIATKKCRQRNNKLSWNELNNTVYINQSLDAKFARPMI